MIVVPTSTVEANAAAAADISARISNALSLVLGSNATPGVFPSYHLELNETIPVLDPGSGQIARSRELILADVQGADVHLFDSTAPESSSTRGTEGYLVGGVNYLVKDGQAQEDIFGIQMTWLSWPLDVVEPLSLAGMGPEAQGSEVIDGRAADKFAIDTAKANPAGLEMLKGMLPMNPEISEAHGTVWLDQETGGLVKLVIDYTGAFKDASGNAVGTGSGHIEITISQVGKVTVSLP